MNFDAPVRTVPVAKQVCPDERPKDVLLIGDSMIKRLQVYGHPQRIWKLCYPGGTAEELLPHILHEVLPGEARVGAVLIAVGTNDISRSRGQIRTLAEVVEYLQKLVLRLAKMYPQAMIVYMYILPRTDLDNLRVQDVNQQMKEFMRARESRFRVRDFTHVFQTMNYALGRHVVNTSYYRNTLQDEVHLSESGTQVQQDVFNKYFQNLDRYLNTMPIDLTKLMWQQEWERFNYWNLKTPYLKVSNYLNNKRLTNFTNEQRAEIIANELHQKTNE